MAFHLSLSVVGSGLGPRWISNQKADFSPTFMYVGVWLVFWCKKKLFLKTEMSDSKYFTTTKKGLFLVTLSMPVV